MPRTARKRTLGRMAQDARLAVRATAIWRCISARITLRLGYRHLWRRPRWHRWIEAMQCTQRGRTWMYWRHAKPQFRSHVIAESGANAMFGTGVSFPGPSATGTSRPEPPGMDSRRPGKGNPGPEHDDPAAMLPRRATARPRAPRRCRMPERRQPRAMHRVLQNRTRPGRRDATSRRCALPRRSSQCGPGIRAPSPRASS